MNICFVVDGGLQMGMGHVQQAMTLARELAGRADISFATKSDEAVTSLLRERGFVATAFRSDDQVLDHLQRLRPNVVVFDKIDVEESLARDIKATMSAGLVIFTNLTGANKYADLAVTADIGSRFQNVSYTDPTTGTLTYFGPKYWVLRREFYEYARKAKTPPRELRDILLIFGGSDPGNMTSAALRELLDKGAARRIDVVLGSHFGHPDEVREILERRAGTEPQVVVHRNIANVAELMFAADLVIASPGLSAFEALCVGTPVLVMPQDTLQRDTYRGFMSMLERSEVGRLCEMIERGEVTRPGDAQIAAMEIGQGVADLVERIVTLGEGRTT